MSKELKMIKYRNVIIAAIITIVIFAVVAAVTCTALMSGAYWIMLALVALAAIFTAFWAYILM